MKRLVSILLALTVCAALVAVVWANAGTVTVVSDTSVDVYGPLSSYAPLGDYSAWGSSSKAVATWVHPSWPWKTDPDGATWISTAQYVEDPVNDSWRKFTKTFELCPGAYDIQPGSIQVNSDNAEEFYFNGVFVGSDGEVQGAYYDNQEWNTVKSYAITPQPGVNTLDFIVRNYACYSPTRSGSYFCGTPPNPQSNPAGLIYKAELIYKCPLQVTIDIKPGSDPNCFNSDGHGVIPVAILGSADFDASTVNPFSVALDGAGVRVKGKSGNAGALEDTNGDGFLDLVVQIVDNETYSGDGMASLSGNLYADFGGTPIEGSDSLCIVPPE